MAGAGSAEVPRANGPQATPLAIEQAFGDLKSSDWILKWAAMSQLARWKVAEAAPALKAILGGSDHPWIRGRALVALAELLGEGVTAEAQARAKDPAPQVRCQAVVALARVRREAAWETVQPLLDDKDATLVQHAVRALVYIRRPEANAKAIALLGHADAAVRAEAASTLGQALAPEAIPALLLRMATDNEPKVRLACEKALTAFEARALFLPMLAALRGELTYCYAAALRVLALRPCPEACEGVAALLRDPPPAYRDVLPDALQLLARLDADRYADIFARNLSHPSPQVRARAIESLSKCANADRFKLLRPMLLDREQGVRVAAFRAIRSIADATPPEGFIEYFAEAIQRGDKYTRHAATDLLCERVPPAELPKVVAILAPVLGGKEKEEREYAAKALARIGDEGVRRRIAAAQGYVTNWMLIGPFPYDNRNRGFGAAFFPEYEVDFQKTYDPVVVDPSAVFKVGEATCGGEKRKAILMQPPTAAQPPSAVGGASLPRVLIATFRLELPEAKDVKLILALGLEDEATDSDGVALQLSVNDQKLLERKLVKPDGWQAAEVSLGEFAGKRVAIELALDPLGNPKGDRVAIADARLVSGDKVLATLAELTDSAPVRVAVPDAKNRLSWQRYQASRIDGEVSLYDVYPPPIDSKIAYGVADLAFAEDRKAVVTVKSDDGFILWLNGVKVAERPGAGESKQEVAVRQGPARFLIKVFNHREWWLYQVRLTDPDGRALDFRQEGQ